MITLDCIEEIYFAYISQGLQASHLGHEGVSSRRPKICSSPFFSHVSVQ